MLEYVPEALTHFQHKPPCVPQCQPYPHVKLTYSSKAQYTEDVNTSLLLDKEGKKYIQEVIGTFLYYAGCVGSTMLLAPGSLATQQAHQTQNNNTLVDKFLDSPPNIPTPSSHTRQVTWSLMGTATPPTFQKPLHAAGPMDTFSCPTMIPFPTTMVRSS